MQVRIMAVAALATLVCVSLVSPASGVNIETVPVGNPGNADDVYGAGYGGVSYAYNIGKYEVTAGQYTEFLNKVAATDTYGLYNVIMADTELAELEGFGCNIHRSGSPGSYTYSVAPDWANRPVNYVSWGDAARFANWLHNGQPIGAQDVTNTEDGAYDLSATQSYYGPDGQTPTKYSDDWYALNDTLIAITREADWKWAIPTEDEWYKAAYHKNDGVTGNYFDYPTSSDTVPSYELVDPDPGNNATFYTFGGGDFTIESPYYRTEGGAHENSDSPYGTFDQGGNVWEWNEAIIGSDRGKRGGGFLSFDNFMRALGRYDVYPTFEDNDLGFRVSEIPEPATLSLLALGGLALIRRKR